MLLLAEKTSTSRVALQNILDAKGLAIAVTGMVIVFVVLVAIAGFIAALPKLLGYLETIMPPAAHHGEASAAAHVSHPSSSPEEVVAAIGAAFHARRQ